MRILYITPSVGDAFYCSNCLRDNFQAQALIESGLDLTIMPIYLPSKTIESNSTSPLFFNAINYWLGHKFFEKSKIPFFLEKIFSAKIFTNLAKPFLGSTSPKSAKKMTLSMIEANDVHFICEFEKIKEWIKSSSKFDIIHISSPLISGIAKALKKEFETPIICSMQDEEVWLDKLDNQSSKNAWNAILLNTKFIDKFIAPSFYYKDKIQKRFPNKFDINVVYPCVNIKEYATASYPKNPTIGFFSRTNKDNGLDLLCEAFLKIKEADSVKNLRLIIGGGTSFCDKKFLKSICKKLSKFSEFVEIENIYDPCKHKDFFEKISVLSVPANSEDAVGLYIIESLASGRPAVEPNKGAFKEIMQDAGLSFKPNSSDSLKEQIENLFNNPKLFERLKCNAKNLSQKKYDSKICSQKLFEIYNSILSRH